MSNAPPDPIVCRLVPADLVERAVAWQTLCDDAITAKNVSRGVQITFASAPGVADSLRALARLEAEGCPWMAFAGDDLPDGQTRLHMTAQTVEGVRAIRSLFTLERLGSEAVVTPS
jgi:hypothetical protein